MAQRLPTEHPSEAGDEPLPVRRESRRVKPVAAVSPPPVETDALLSALRGWARGRAVSEPTALSLEISIREEEERSSRACFSGVLRRHPADGDPEPLARAAIERLAEEVGRGQVTLGNPERALLDACRGGLLEDAAGTIAPAPLGALLQDPLVAGLVTLEDGTDLRVASEPLRLEPGLRSRDGGLEIDLVVRQRGSRERSFASLKRFGGEGVGTHSLVDGVLAPLVTDLPDFLLGDLLAREAPLPVPAGSLLPALLAEAVPSLRSVVDRYTRFHAMQPLLVVSEEAGDWLCFRLLARPRTSGWQPGVAPSPGDVLFEWLGDGTWKLLERAPSEGSWQSLALRSHPEPSEWTGCEEEGGSKTPEESWFERPRREDTRAAEAWLAANRSALGLRPRSGHGSGLWMRMVPRRMEALAAARSTRPPDLPVFAQGDALRLLDREEPRVLRLRVADGDEHWLAISAEWAGEMEGISDAEIDRLRAADSAFVRLAGGWQRSEIARAVDRAASVVSDLGLTPGAGVARVPLRQLAGAAPGTLIALEAAGSDAESGRAVADLRERIDSWRARAEVAPPSALHAELRSYQREGFEFLVRAAELETGAVLADDMGLGKTLQALAWIAWLREKQAPEGPVLVVAPASVTHNWQREAERFVPGLRVLVLGAGRDRAALWNQVPHADLVITNYALLRRDVARFRELELQAAVLDEAQTIKNPDSSVTAAVLGLQARFRLALTGTPLENRPLDLWSILRFTSPGWLGSRTAFARRFEAEETTEDDLRHLEARMRPVLLRRRKRDVARDLPERIEKEQQIEFSPEQRRLYLAEVAHVRRTLEEVRRNDAPRAGGHMHVLAALTRLRQICCHPGMIGSHLSSAKLDALLEILEPLVADGQRVLVFSQFVRCLELLRPALEKAGIPIHMLTGATARREEVVERFRTSEGGGVFLLSLMAAGTGLNLTEAPYVVLFDPWWNPAIEAQAIDRAHRIGQDRTVVATRLVVRGTIEERILALQRRKQAVADAILGTGSGRMHAFTDEEIDFLLGSELEEPAKESLTDQGC